MNLYEEPELNKAIALVSGNPLVVLLKRWSELEPNRVRNTITSGLLNASNLLAILSFALNQCKTK